MDEVSEYLSQTRKASRRIFSSGIPSKVGLCEAPSLGPRLPPKLKRLREEPVAISNRPRNSFALQALQTLRLLTPTVSRQHLPPENFVRSSMERYACVRERTVAMRMMLKDAQGRWKGDLKDNGAKLLELQGLEGGADHHYFDMPLGRPIGDWFRFIERHGPLEPFFCALSESFVSKQFGGNPAFTMLALASDGDLNNLFCVVMTKVVRGVKEGKFELQKQNRKERDDSGDDGDAPNRDDGSPNEIFATLRNVSWLFLSPTESVALLDFFTNCFPDTLNVEKDVQLFLNCLGEIRATVNGKNVKSLGFGCWIYTVLVAVELPLDPTNERLLQQLLQLVCRSITFIRSLPSEAVLKPERCERMLCTLDTILVILCRQFHVNNKDLVPL